jgi:hypothetical protein
MELEQGAATKHNDDMEQRYLTKRQKEKRKIMEEMTENVGVGLSFEYIYCLVIMLMMF